MDLSITPEQQQFRQQVREWLEANKPGELRPPSRDIEATRAFDMNWQRTLYDGGWAGISWPKEVGGRGLDAIEQLIFLQEYAAAGAPDEGTRFNGLNLGGPTIVAYGSEEQKATYLPPILKGEAIWCQGFSEPGAGSDLAGIRTRGIIDGDELVISGQKIWTSFARFADFQQVVVRTDPNEKRHAGLSWVILDMKTPGITIRPIPDMAGGDDLHEVFYDEVRVPLANVVGGLGNGWRVSMGQLQFERGTAFMTLQIELTRKLDELIELARKQTLPSGKKAINDDGLRRELGKLRMEVRALQAMTLLAVSRIRRSGQPGAEGSFMKLYYSDLVQRLGELAVNILGTDRLDRTGEWDSWSHWLLWSFGVAIGGGTSEIQKNIIADKVLGLPR